MNNQHKSNQHTGTSHHSPSQETPVDSPESDSTGEDSDTTLKKDKGAIEVPGVDGESYFNWQAGASQPLSLPHIAGYPKVRSQLYRLLVDPIQSDHNLYQRFKVGVPSLLLAGPPGTGKTHAAKSLAGELSLPHVILSPSDVQSQYLNRSARLIDRLFLEAEELANRKGNSLIFIDEIDAVLPTRSSDSGMHQETNKIVNQFLVNMQTASDRDILLIAATNRPEALDAAATRHGRLTETIWFGEPDEEERLEIIRYHLADRPHSLSDHDIRMLVDQTEKTVPAEIKALVEQAAREAAFNQSKELRKEHFMQVLAEI